MTRTRGTGRTDEHEVAVGRQTPFEPDGGRGAEPLPADRRVRVPVRLRDHALVAPRGNVEWLCSPRPDGHSVFASMLDRAAGGFRFGPTGVTVPTGGRYVK